VDHVALNLAGVTRGSRDGTRRSTMSRAFTRALVVSTIGGLAVAPAIAFAAGGGSGAHSATVTTVLAPKHAEGGKDILLSARVGLAPTKPVAPTEDLEPDRKSPKGGKDGHGGKKGKGKGHHHRAAETGEITFIVDGKALTPVRLSHGRALEKLELSPGNHTAVASYSGDGHYSPSKSDPVSFTVS
jgi:hypothetical protein